MIQAAPDKIIVKAEKKHPYPKKLDAAERQDFGTVHSAGQDTPYLEGTQIFFDPFAADDFEDEGQQYLVLEEQQVLAIKK